MNSNVQLMYQALDRLWIDLYWIWGALVAMIVTVPLIWLNAWLVTIFLMATIFFLVRIVIWFQQDRYLKRCIKAVMEGA